MDGPLEAAGEAHDRRKKDLMAACDLGTLGAAIGAGWEFRDPGRAPGEPSLSALLGSATLDPERAIREYRDEARIAARSRLTLDAFSSRRLLARCRRYQLAALLVEERCGACTERCVTAPSGLGPATRERRLAGERRAEPRPGDRRFGDRLRRLELAPA